MNDIQTPRHFGQDQYYKVRGGSNHTAKDSVDGGVISLPTRSRQHVYENNHIPQTLDVLRTQLILRHILSNAMVICTDILCEYTVVFSYDALFPDSKQQY